jgi:hypothetical protein
MARAERLANTRPRQVSCKADGRLEFIRFVVFDQLAGAGVERQSKPPVMTIRTAA